MKRDLNTAVRLNNYYLRHFVVFYPQNGKKKQPKYWISPRMNGNVFLTWKYQTKVEMNENGPEHWALNMKLKFYPTNEHFCQNEAINLGPKSFRVVWLIIKITTNFHQMKHVRNEERIWKKINFIILLFGSHSIRK